MKVRIAYLDYVKVFLTSMVIIHHVAQSYGDTGGAWLVFDTKQVSWLGKFMFFNASYLMALYFFISGYFTFVSFRKKTIAQFVVDRLKRLGIPLLVVSFGLSIPMHYFVNHSQENFFAFAWDLYVNKPPLAVNHLWFVMSLFAYSIILAFMVKGMDKQIKEGKSFKWFYPLMWIAIVSVLNIVMRHTFPIDRWVVWAVPLEPAHLPNYFLAFLAGYFVCQNKFMEQINWKIALGYFALYLVMEFLTSQFRNESNIYYFKIVLENTLCVGVSMLLIKLCQLLPEDEKGFLKILSENTYGTYLVHLFIVIAIQYWFLSIDVSGLTKFLVVSILSVVASFVVSYLVRKIPGVAKVV